jgi:hypothetical protein
MKMRKWSKIPYGSPLMVDGHGEIFFQQGGRWVSVYSTTGITRAEIEEMHAKAAGRSGMPSSWIFDDDVDSTTNRKSPFKSSSQNTIPTKLSASKLKGSSLNKTAVKKANEELWADFPELKRRLLTLNAKDLRYRRKWCAYYHYFARPIGGSTSVSGKPSTTAPSESLKSSVENNSSTKVKCSHESLIVSCSHKGRGYRVTLPGTRAGSVNDPSVLQVISGVNTNKDQISCSTSLKAGPCSTHKDKILKFSGNDPISISNTKLEFETVADSNYSSNNIFRNQISPFKYIMPYSARYKSYWIWAESCDHSKSQRAEVQVYPDIEWDAGVKVGMEYQRSASYDKNSRTLERSVQDPHYSITGHLSVKADGNQKDLILDFEEYIETALKIINATKSTVHYVSSSLDHIGAIDLKVLWPSISISGTWGYRELNGSGLVGYAYDATIALKPIIGLEAKADILEPIVNLIPYAGPIINRARDIAREGIGDDDIGVQADVAIWIGAEGSIEGEYTVTKYASNSNVKSTGKISDTIGIYIEGVAEAEFSILFVKAGASVKIGGESSITGEIIASGDEKGPYTDGEITWNGITVYYIEHYEFKYNESTRLRKRRAASGRMTKETSHEESAGIGSEEKKEYVLVKPRTFEFERHYFLGE